MIKSCFIKLLCTVAIVLFINPIYSQLSISTIDSTYVITFDTSLENVNNGIFTGIGFSPNPTNGQLDSHAFSINGLSDGDLNFGDTKTTGDYARGENSAGVGTAGIYAFEVETNNIALGVQPASNDFTPGEIILKVQNNIGVTINSFLLDFTTWIFNDQPRSNSIEFSFSIDGINYTNTNISITSDEVSDTNPSWANYIFELSEIDNINLPNNQYLYLKWTFEDVAGSDRRDQFALDDISITLGNGTSWNGNADSDWHNSSNWSNGVPNSSLYTYIESSSNKPSIPSNSFEEVNNIIINPLDTLTILSGGAIKYSRKSTGFVTYHRELPSKNWHFIGAPVENPNIQTFNNNQPTIEALIKYNNDLGKWEFYDNNNPLHFDENFISGKGYGLNLTETGTIKFNGNIYSSFNEYTITDATNDAYNLISNPYIGYLAANSNTGNNNNFLEINNSQLNTGTLWFWDETENDYTTINMASNAFYIAPTQGFFVEAKSGGGTLNLPISMMGTPSSDSFYKGQPKVNSSLIIEVENHNLTKKSEIYFLDQGSDNIDNGYDSPLFNQNPTDFTIYTQTPTYKVKKLAIQSLNSSKIFNSIIPIGIIAKKDSKITFSISTQKLEGAIVYLEDRSLQTLTNLSEYDNYYSITLNEDLKGSGRFYLHTSNNTLKVKNNTQIFINIYNKSNKTLIIEGLKPFDTEVSIWNVLGEKIYTKNLIPKTKESLRLPRFFPGMYIVKINSPFGNQTKKIVLTNQL